MKTLKKTLCLVLAMVMVFGLLAVSSSARELEDVYDDAGDITYKEAVDVLTGIGILEGYEDGKFLAEQNVTRAEAAKIIAYLMIGGADEADALKATKAPFDDVSQGHWAAGYIEYCVQNGVINGCGDNKFCPNEEVTGLQFAKMLLCVIGYGVNGEYTGTDWAINTAKDALQYGIFKDNLDGADNDAATREEVALYAFNTLYLNKVTYSALLGGYIEDITIADNAESNKGATLAEDFWIEVEHQFKDDEFMRYDGGWYWVQYQRNPRGPGEEKKQISDVYGNDYRVGTFTTPVSAYDVYALTGKGTADLYIDGVLVDDNVSIDKNINRTIEGTGYGVETYVYKIGSEIRICCINIWLGRIDSVLKETDYNYAKTRLTGAFDSGNYTLICDTQEFAEDSYVMFNYSKKHADTVRTPIGVVDMWQAQTFNAKLSQMTNVNGEYKRATANGTEYIQATMDYVTDGIRASRMSPSHVNGDTYTFYLSDNTLNDEVYLKGIELANDADAAEFVYVAQFGQKLITTDLNDYYNLTADVYYTDGSHKVLNIDAFEVWSELHDSKAALEEVIDVLTNGTPEDLEDLDTSDYWWWFVYDTESADADIIEQLETVKEEMAALESALLDLIECFEQYANGFVSSINNAYIDTLNENYTGLYVLEKGNKSDYKVIPVQAYTFMTRWIVDDAVSAPTEKGITPVYNKVSALCAGNYSHNAIFSDASTYFFYVSGTYGKSSFNVTVYQGTNAAPTTTGKNQGLTQFYAVKAGDGRFYADVALVRGQFKDVVTDGDTVYYYNGKSYLKDNLDGTWTVTYELYNKNEKVTDISYTFDSYAEAKAQLDWDNTLTWHWVIDGWFTDDGDNYYSGLKEALDFKDGRYVATKIKDLWYTPYMIIQDIVGDTMYSNYLTVNPAIDYYNGYALTENTKVVVINEVEYNRDWWWETGVTYVDSVETIKDYTSQNRGDLVVCFSYDKDHNVDTIYIVGAVHSWMWLDYEGNEFPTA